MSKSKKISLSKIIKETENEYNKAKEESIKRAYRDLLSLLENIYSATRIDECPKTTTIYIFSSIPRPADQIHSIIETINKYSSDRPQLYIEANHKNGGRLHYDVTIYRPSTNVAATAVRFNTLENSTLSDEDLDNEYDALLCELRKRIK